MNKYTTPSEPLPLVGEGDKQPKKSYPDDRCNTACREDARSFLNRKVQQLRDQANSLEELSRTLPLVLPHSADQALYNLLEKLHTY